MNTWALVVVLLSAAPLVAAEPSAREKDVFERVTGHFRQKQYAEAVRVSEEALRAAEATHGAESPGVQYYADLLAQTCRLVGYWDRGRSLGPDVTRDALYERSASLYRRVATILERQHGADHPAIADTLFELALLYDGDQWEWHKPKEAEQVLLRVLLIQEQQEKPDRLSLMRTLSFYARVSDKLGKKAEAEGFREKVRFLDLGPRTEKYKLALQLEEKGRYLSALVELGLILECPRSEGELFHAHQPHEEPSRVLIKRTMAGILKKMPVPPVVPEEARRHVVKAEGWLTRKEAGDTELQLAAFEYHDAVKIAPYLPSLYYNAALIYAKRSRYEQAIDRMWMYLDLVPDAPDAGAAMEKIRQWGILKTEKDKPK